MWIQVRTMDGRKSARVDKLSKLTKIEEVRERLVEEFGAETERQRLFYRGKQLEDGHTLFDYDVGLNDIIQLMIRPKLNDLCPPTSNGSATTPDSTPSPALTNGVTHDPPLEEDEVMRETEEAMESSPSGTAVASNGVCEGRVTENGEGGASNGHTSEEEDIGLYKVNEKVDARDLNMGAWFEAVVVKVTSEAPPTSETACSSKTTETVVYYHVRFEDYSEEEVLKLTERDVRPRAKYRMQWDQLEVGQTVMVNYNPDAPRLRGFWYDGVVTRKETEGKKIFCKLLLGGATGAEQEVRVKFVDEIFKIESRDSPVNGLSAGEEAGDGEEGGEARMKKPDCNHCKDNPRRMCKHCACCVCGGKDGPDKQLLCDECDQAYHLWCLTPPLETVPESDEWYCPQCKTDCTEVIKAGDKMRLSKKKANMASNKQSCNRDWGRGMACVGRSKVCTIVPSNHLGPIPGVPVGTLWKFRVQVSEAGVHRPHVAGIHGRENEGSYSIVLSGGYDDDQDNGNEFTYSGSGGRDLSGNKRTAKQSMDQKLTAMNRALAKNCNAPIDDKKGGTARDWRSGKPVRVVRNHKGRKTSKYAPEEGNRYDGIYKVAKYWPEKSSAGFIVWKYLLRRDDSAPAPWSTEGKKITKKLGLTMQYPDGYLEAQAAAQESSEEDSGKGKRGRKRKNPDSGSPASSPAQNKQPRYDLTKEQKSLLKADVDNKKTWDELLTSTRMAGLLGRIQEEFTCIVCQELVYQPLTTPCSHNICKACLVRSFKAEVFNCPSCRQGLGKDYSLDINHALQTALLSLFPGYDGGR